MPLVCENYPFFFQKTSQNIQHDDIINISTDTIKISKDTLCPKKKTKIRPNFYYFFFQYKEFYYFVKENGWKKKKKEIYNYSLGELKKTGPSHYLWLINLNNHYKNTKIQDFIRDKTNFLNIWKNETNIIELEEIKMHYLCQKPTNLRNAKRDTRNIKRNARRDAKNAKRDTRNAKRDTRNTKRNARRDARNANDVDASELQRLMDEMDDMDEMDEMGSPSEVVIEESDEIEKEEEEEEGWDPFTYKPIKIVRSKK